MALRSGQQVVVTNDNGNTRIHEQLPKSEDRFRICTFNTKRSQTFLKVQAKGDDQSLTTQPGEVTLSPLRTKGSNQDMG